MNGRLRRDITLFTCLPQCLNKQITFCLILKNTHRITSITQSQKTQLSIYGYNILYIREYWRYGFMRPLILTICLFLLSAMNCHADTALHLNADSNGIDISNASEYVCIKENIDSIKLISAYKFTPWTGDLINFGYTRKYCWVKFNILNSESNRQAYYLTTRFSFVDHLDAFYQQHGEKKHIPLGDQYALPRRDYASSRQIGKIELESGEALTIYIKAYTNATLVVPISIYAEKPFIEHISATEWLDGIFYGILFGLLILSLLLYWYFRDPTYASYFFHVVFMMVLLLNMDGKTIYLFKNSPQIIDYFHMAFTSLTMITAVIFARFYLNLAQYKNLNFFSHVNIAIGMTYIFLLPFLPTQISNMATSLVSILVAAFLLVAGIIQLKRGLSEAIYYCVGWSILLFGVIMMSSSILGNRLALDEMLTVIKFSFIIQQIILCFGLSKKIKTLQKKEEKSREISLRHQMELDTRNEFFAKMSHEIRTPINGVLGCLQLIDQNHLNKEQKDYVNTARNSADILLCIINDILDFSKIEAGKLKLENKAFDLHQLIHESIQVFELERKQSDIKFIEEISNDVPRYIISDSIRLHQILLNLISNAIKFTSKGSITIKARLLNLDKKACQLEFKVIDTGIGMEENIKDILFLPFQQATQPNITQHRGTGLGLSICRQICELMNGSIHVESHPNVGTTFTFTITTEVTENIEQKPQQESSNINHLLDDLTEITVLFAEDNPIKSSSGYVTKNGGSLRIQC